MLRRTLLLAPLALLLAASPAFGGDAHHEELDGCDHGATSKPCRPDPSPNGKDCLPHGNHGGINEDHCLTTSTTTGQPATTTSTLPTPVTTTITPAENGSSPTTTSTNLISPTTGTDLPTLGCVTPDGHPYVTNIEQRGCPTPAARLHSAPAGELAHTGWDAGLLFVIGTAVLMAGLSCWFCGKAIE